MSAALVCPGLWHSQCTTGAQTGRQLTLQCTASLDVERLIDGFVRDPHGGIIGEVERKPLTDLLWAPTLTPAVIRAATMPAADPRHLRIGVDPVFTDTLWFKPKESEMSKYRTAYAPEFRQQLIELVHAGRSAN